MRKLGIALIVLGLIFGVSGKTMAAGTANQTVQFQVTAIDEISVNGNPGPLIVTNVAAAGSEPTQVSDDTTTYNITTNGTSRKITGQITSGGAMPANTTLQLNLAAPTGGTSQGDVTLLDSAASDLVTGISQKAESNLTITYKFGATVAAGVVSSSSRTVTLTLTAS